MYNLEQHKRGFFAACHMFVLIFLVSLALIGCGDASLNITGNNNNNKGDDDGIEKPVVPKQLISPTEEEIVYELHEDEKGNKHYELGHHVKNYELTLTIRVECPEEARDLGTFCLLGNKVILIGDDDNKTELDITPFTGISPGIWHITDVDESNEDRDKDGNKDIYGYTASTGGSRPTGIW